MSETTLAPADSVAPGDGTHEPPASHLAVLEQRLRAAHSALGRKVRTVAAAPLDPVRRKPYQPVVAAPAEHPGDTHWWPTASAAPPPLDAGPGRGCAGLRGQGLPVIGVSVCGLARAEADRVVLETAALQARERSWIPLFLADGAADLDLFRRRGYAVELVPTAAALRRCPGTVAGDAALAARLRAIAAAWAVAHFVDRGRRPLPLPPPAPATAELRLFFDKDYRRYNPYQHLLYANLPGVAASAATIAEAIAWMAGQPPCGTAPVFHLNWEEGVYRDAGDPAAARARARAFLADVARFRALGGRLLWTVHNKAPHENDLPKVHAALVRGVARQADLVHVHARHMADWVRQQHGVAAERIVVAPHGDYQDVHGRPPTLARARARLGLAPAGRILGLVGNLRPYKGAAALLAAFTTLPPGAARLLLAGRQQPPLDPPLLDRARERGAIVEDRALDDAAVALHVGACDAIVLPYREAATSGALLLAFTLGRPVIVPDLPVFAEIVEDGWNGLVYPRGDEAALAAALRRFLALDDAVLAGMARAAAATAQRHDWRWIGRRLAAALWEVARPGAAAPTGQRAAVGGLPASMANTRPNSVICQPPAASAPSTAISR